MKAVHSHNKARPVKVQPAQDPDLTSPSSWCGGKEFIAHRNIAIGDYPRGRKPFRIWFTCSHFRSLLRLARAARNWTVFATTTQAGGFCLESTSCLTCYKGRRAYAEAEKIASNILTADKDDLVTLLDYELVSSKYRKLHDKYHGRLIRALKNKERKSDGVQS